mgnify:CR=1 FL=1
MLKSINIRVSGELAEHVNKQISNKGLYENASEYIRDLIRNDLKQNESKKFKNVEELDAYLLELAKTPREEFVDMDIKNIIASEHKKIGL